MAELTCWKCGDPATYYTSKLDSDEPERYVTRGAYGEEDVPSAWCDFHFPRVWHPARVTRCAEIGCAP